MEHMNIVAYSLVLYKQSPEKENRSKQSKAFGESKKLS